MNHISGRQRKEIIERLEDYADMFVRKTRPVLPHIARVCLVSTFIEDGFRLCTQWSDQIDYLISIWSCPTLIAALFILINIIGQFGGSGLVLSRIRVGLGVAILMATVLLQTVGYGIWNRYFLMRNVALIGSLLLILVESTQQSKTLLAGLPSTGAEEQPRHYLLLGGRLMTVLIFLTLIHWTEGVFYFVQALCNLALIIMVAVGFKTKLCAMILVAWLTLMNFWYNNFWYSGTDQVLWDFLKYDFFQTWSVIGGLLFIVAYGAGGVSVDSYKKRF